MIARMVLIGLILILPALGSAEETGAPKRARGVTAKESEAARQQRLEDLERRVRALEQQYELKEAEMPAPDAPPPSQAEK